MSRSSFKYWIVRFVLGITLIVAAGSGVFRTLAADFDPMGLATFLPAFVGFALAMSSITPLVRLSTVQARVRREWSTAASAEFARASLPRRVWYLMASIAEADGPMTTIERETIRSFLLERFLEPDDADALRTWEAQPLPVTDRIGLAARIATGLSDQESDSLFCWCCLVAFADDSFREREHAALQDVAKGLGLESERARFLFHLARAQHLDGRAGPARRTPPDARAHALSVLGLPVDATKEAIRKRHRQLARQFHPDVHTNLGPVAQREATERFQEIQRAYEILSG
ncbi:MAG: DnaJ domain-containing protein [Planctomycetes bacterium]|nr:DnaJ domain-containing protein [Planctomycetota bacterium]